MLIDSSLIIMGLFFSRRLGTEGGVLPKTTLQSIIRTRCDANIRCLFGASWSCVVFLFFLPFVILPEGNETMKKAIIAELQHAYISIQ